MLETCQSLHSARLTYLPVDGDGWVDPQALAHGITDHTVPGKPGGIAP